MPNQAAKHPYPPTTLYTIAIPMPINPIHKACQLTKAQHLHS